MRYLRWIWWRGVPTVLLLLLLLAISLRVAADLREVTAFGEDLPAQGLMITTAEGGVFVTEAGAPDAPMLLFSHGVAAWSGLWGPTLDAMAADGYRAVAFDMTPFGYSEHAADQNYRRARQADRVLALIDALGTKPVLVAHSVSAGPMVEAAMRRPEAVSGLVVVAGAVGLDAHLAPREVPGLLQPMLLRQSAVAATAANPWLTETFLRAFLHKKDAATPWAVAVLKMPLTRQGYTQAVAHWLPSLLGTPKDALSTRREAWAALDLPTAFVWGDRDTVTPLAQGQALQALVPGSRLLPLAGVGHIPQLEDPEAFQIALRAALGQLATGGEGGL